MIAKLKDDNFIYLEMVTPEIEELLKEKFSAMDPRSRYSTAFELGTWDGKTVRYSVKKKRLYVSFLPELEDVCQVNNIPFDVVDERVRPKFFPIPQEHINKDLLPGIELADYQVRALKAMHTNERGILDLPTGAGKTELMAAAISMYPGCPTAIIAEEVIVSQQIKERLELRKVVEEVGEFFAGKRPNGQVVIVGSIQALRSPPQSARRAEKKRTGDDKAFRTRQKNAQYLQKMVERCHMIMVDECDRASSDSYKDLFLKYGVNARYVYGFSGTPFDKDKPVQNLYIRERFGPVICKVPRSEVEANGRIIPIKFFMMSVDENGNKRDKTDNNTAIKDFMVNNNNLHNKVNNICKAFPEDGTLILVESIELGNILSEKIKNSAFICGSTPLKKRNEAIKKFEKRDLKVLIGSRILRRGLDLKGGCENLILCYDGQMSTEFIQRVGRALRKNDRGWARVFDFLFLNNYYLYKHSKKRLETIVGMNYDSKVVLDSGTIAGEDLIKRRWRLPKFKR